MPQPALEIVSNWKLTDVDGDGFITLYDLEKSPLNYLPLPSSSVTSSTKFQISVEFAPTAGNNLQSDSLNMNMDFIATSWDKSSSTGGISPRLMQSFLGQPVILATTCTSVTSSQNPSIYGQPVTFTANVNAQSGSLLVQFNSKLMVSTLVHPLVLSMVVPAPRLSVILLLGIIVSRQYIVVILISLPAPVHFAVARRSNRYLNLLPRRLLHH